MFLIEESINKLLGSKLVYKVARIWLMWSCLVPKITLKEMQNSLHAKVFLRVLTFFFSFCKTKLASISSWSLLEEGLGFVAVWIPLEAKALNGSKAWLGLAYHNIKKSQLSMIFNHMVLSIVLVMSNIVSMTKGGYGLFFVNILCSTVQYHVQGFVCLCLIVIWAFNRNHQLSHFSIHLLCHRFYNFITIKTDS